MAPGDLIVPHHAEAPTANEHLAEIIGTRTEGKENCPSAIPSLGFFRR